LTINSEIDIDLIVAFAKGPILRNRLTKSTILDECGKVVDTESNYKVQMLPLLKKMKEKFVS
jgi:hypothetical protein